MTCECYGIIHDEPRATLFSGIFEKDRIPIKYPIIAGTAQTGSEVYQFYEVDASRISPEQKQELAKRIAPKFHLTPEEVLQDMANPDFKIPLKADGVMVAWCARHMRAAL